MEPLAIALGVEGIPHILQAKVLPIIANYLLQEVYGINLKINKETPDSSLTSYIQSAFVIRDRKSFRAWEAENRNRWERNLASRFNSEPTICMALDKPFALNASQFLHLKKFGLSDDLFSYNYKHLINNWIELLIL